MGKYDKIFGCEKEPEVLEEEPTTQMLALRKQIQTLEDQKSKIELQIQGLRKQVKDQVGRN